jgi:hypothetical protein
MTRGSSQRSFLQFARSLTNRCCYEKSPANCSSGSPRPSTARSRYSPPSSAYAIARSLNRQFSLRSSCLQLHLQPYSLLKTALLLRLARRRPPSTEHLALIYASGYRCSARRLRTADGASVYFAAATLPSLDERDRFCAWLTRNGPEIPVAFYGDLDYAGMSILARLRSSFPHAIAWQPGYDVMLASLRSGAGHPPEAARKGGQQDPISTGCPYADEVLLPALRQYGRFVDQELYGLPPTSSRAS